MNGMTKKQVAVEIERIVQAAKKHQRISEFSARLQVEDAAYEGRKKCANDMISNPA
jgi:hypothetical protein